jgi:hypothetical protein
MANAGFQVFDKLTGTSVFGPVATSSIWAGFGGACENGGRGNPVVIYDQLADRWIISQSAIPGGATSPQDECIAISQTGNATGAWYRYDFHLTSNFLDYPKLGVWPDGYYMAANIFDTTGTMFLGPQPFVFDRVKMLVGDPTATSQTPGIIGGSTEATFLPADLDGILLPLAGDPNHFVAFPQGHPLGYKIWAYHVDFANPSNSTFTREAGLRAASFTSLCQGNCVPQAGTSMNQESTGDRLMFRNAYRRFSDGHESLLNNYTVSANSVAAIRWFELQRTPPGNWSIFQQSTYQPDTTWRWMGSIASDNQGNLALGFSASSSSINPQVRYAGRLASDPLNTLSGEQHLFDGTGSHSTSSSWGGYSDLTVDPVDDCTFYYTNEYYATTGSIWETRIGYFRFATCTAPQKGTAQFVVTGCTGGVPVSNAFVSIDSRPYGSTLSDGTYDAALSPGSHSYSISKAGASTQTGNFTITNGQTTSVNVCLENVSTPTPTPTPTPTSTATATSTATSTATATPTATPTTTPTATPTPYPPALILWEQYGTGINPAGNTTLKWKVFMHTDRPRPMGLVIHGGEFRALNPGPAYVAQDLYDAGFNVACIGYRLADPGGEMHPPMGDQPVGDHGYYPEQLDDISQAIIAARNGTTPETAGRVNGKVFAVGGSSGATDALWFAGAAYHGGDKLDCAICLSGPYFFADPVSWPMRCGNDVLGVYCNYVNCDRSDPACTDPGGFLDLASPYLRFSATSSPVYVFSTNEDKMPPNQWQLMVAYLLSVGAPFNSRMLIETPQVGSCTRHSFHYWNPEPGCPDEVATESIAFIKTYCPVP